MRNDRFTTITFTNGQTVSITGNSFFYPTVTKSILAVTDNKGNVHYFPLRNVTSYVTTNIEKEI